jgi:hypothetical protein
VGERYILWTQFVITFVQAAVNFSSLLLLRGYDVRMQGLNAFMTQGSPMPGGSRDPLSFLL